MEQRRSVGQRWSETRPTKTQAFWIWAVSVVAIMIIGFTWGGWVTGATARTMAAAMSEEAVVKRLAPMCVARFKEDRKGEEKLKALKELNSWQHADYVQKQGWATMPGEREPESSVATACAKLLMLVTK